MKLEYTIYGRPDCYYCSEAIKLLEALELPYSYMNADTSHYFQQEFVAKGVTQVPQIFVRGEESVTDREERHIGGYEELMGELM